MPKHEKSVSRPAILGASGKRVFTGVGPGVDMAVEVGKPYDVFVVFWHGDDYNALTPEQFRRMVSAVEAELKVRGV